MKAILLNSLDSIPMHVLSRTYDLLHVQLL